MPEKLHIIIQQIRGSKMVPAIVLALALSILGGTVYFGTRHLQRHMHEHLVNRDGETLHAVALARQFSTDPDHGLANRLLDPAGQLELALSISQIKEGVIAVRLFDSTGNFVTAFPLNVQEAGLDDEIVAQLLELNPVSYYHLDGRLSDFFWLMPPENPGTNATPLLEVNIPIFARGQRSLLASAQLILDGRDLELELAQLDEHLWGQALVVFAGGALLLTGALWWAYRRLRRVNAMLQDRTAHLLRANHELTLSAKTSALGSVTAHLIHGLSNPLASLQDFVTHPPAAGTPADEWQDAIDSTRRMQELVNEVVRVLSEENSADHYELSLQELVEILASKVHPAAQKLGVNYCGIAMTEGILSNRDANLVLLILQNLVQNALQATPSGKAVRLEITGLNGQVFCEVLDEGPGFPSHLTNQIFSPVCSTKGSSGIGLAISKQLAHQLGAQLELKISSPAGCVFDLTLPRTLFTDHQAVKADTVFG